MLEWPLLFMMDLMILKPFSFYFIACSVYIYGYLCHFYIKMCSIQKTDLPIHSRVQSNMYLPESPFFKNSLAGTSGLCRCMKCAKSLLPISSGLKCRRNIVIFCTLTDACAAIYNLEVTPIISPA